MTTAVFGIPVWTQRELGVTFLCQKLGSHTCFVMFAPGEPQLLVSNKTGAAQIPQHWTMTC